VQKTENTEKTWKISLLHKKTQEVEEEEEEEGNNKLYFK